MCRAFSCIVTRQGKVFWEAGLDSHDELISKFKVRDDTIDMEEISHAKIEIIPNQKNKYPYLYPDDKWTLQIDEKVTPSWLLPKHKKIAWEAWAEWKKQVYQFNFQEILNPIHPFKIRKHKPSKQDILLLKEWDSVRDSVRDSVGAYSGSLFPNIKDWKYTKKIKADGYPYQSCVNLWKGGFIPSFDGKAWRLHSGKNASIVFEITKEKLMEVR